MRGTGGHQCEVIFIVVAELMIRVECLNPQIQRHVCGCNI